MRGSLNMNNKHKAIKRYWRNPEKFDVLELFDAIGRSRKLTLGNEDDISTFTNIISDSLSKNNYNTMIYGKRVEAMFAYMVASLGKCLLVKKEDGGDVFVVDTYIEIPDYRIILADDSQMLVEVKNHHPKDISGEYSMDANYLAGLSKYADMMKVDLRVAIYWSQLNKWTLLSISDFEDKGNKSVVSLNNAMKRNQMSTLGDVLIGTVPPLIIRLNADKTKESRLAENNSAHFTIKSVEFLCNNKIIKCPDEQRIAYALICYGSWEDEQTEATLDDTMQIECVEFSYSPSDSNMGIQGFDIVDLLSAIVSRQYGELTAPKGKVDRLSPDVDPGLLGFIIPDDYQGIDLPLWRFRIEPSLDGKS